MPTPTSRRNNAPVNPPRQPSLVPEPLICIAIALGVMGVIFLSFSFLGIFAEGDAGKTLARLFAGSLFLSGLLLFLLGFGLLADRRGDNRYYVVPTILGTLIGSAASALFVAGTGGYVLLPFAFSILALRPFRAMFGVSKAGKR